MLQCCTLLSVGFQFRLVKCVLKCDVDHTRGRTSAFYDLRAFPWSLSEAQGSTFYPFILKAGASCTRAQIILTSSGVRPSNIVAWHQDFSGQTSTIWCCFICIQVCQVSMNTTLIFTCNSQLSFVYTATISINTCKNISSVNRERHKYKHKKKQLFPFSYAYAYVYVAKISV